MAKRRSPKKVETIRHKDVSLKNIPTAEYQAVMADDERSPIQVAYKRRNRDLDPQLVWRGKDEQDWSDLVVQAPPLYIQEKVHPKVLIDDLIRQSEEDVASESGFQTDLFADQILDESDGKGKDCVSISTMHLAKGLEFRAVAVMACDDEVIPLQDRIETVADSADLEEVYDTERHLLYVAGTRARDHLLITGVTPASEFLDDLQM